MIDIRKATIAIEVTKLRHLASANSVRDFVNARSDRQHRHSDTCYNSPGRSSFEYHNANHNDKHSSSFRQAGSPYRGKSPTFKRSGS